MPTDKAALSSVLVLVVAIGTVTTGAAVTGAVAVCSAIAGAATLGVIAAPPPPHAARIVVSRHAAMARLRRHEGLRWCGTAWFDIDGSRLQTWEARFLANELANLSAAARIRSQPGVLTPGSWVNAVLFGLCAPHTSRKQCFQALARRRTAASPTISY